MSEISWNTSLQKKKHGQPGAVLAAFCSFSFSSSSGRLVSSLSQIPFPIVSSAPLQDLGARGTSPANTISLPAPHLAHQTAITPSETPRALGSSRAPSPREPSRFPLSFSLLEWARLLPPAAAMSAVNITNVAVLDNPTAFLNPFQFEISYECLVPLDDGKACLLPARFSLMGGGLRVS
jgi:hypothetical protein